MSRHIRNTGLESRTARLKLAPNKIHRLSLGGKLSLGYQRSRGAGRWIARRYVGNEQYTTKTLAEADDLADGDGGTVLNFAQAQDKARVWASDLDKADRIAALGPAITVRIATREYLEERSASRDARGKLKYLAPFAATPLAALTVDDLKQWGAGLRDKMSEASARRVANDVRACFNAAARRHGAKLPPTLRDVIRDGLAPPRGVQVENRREKQVLPDADIRRLIQAAAEVDAEGGWGGDLHAMILVLAATGCRFSQAARLCVRDLQVKEARLMTPTSRKGSGAKGSHTPIPLSPDVVDALKRAAAGRKGHEALLVRPHWRRAPGGQFGVLEVYARSGWTESHTLSEKWRAIVARAGLPNGTIAYSLRHSSIVRGLRAGLPTALVAKLHDTSAAMIETYYAAFLADALDTLARGAVIPLVTPPPTPIRAVVEG